MKLAKKIILLLTSIAFLVFIGLASFGNFETLINGYKSVVQLIVDSFANSDVYSIATIVLTVAVIALPIVGIIISFVKVKQNTIKNPFDFLSILFATVGLLPLCVVHAINSNSLVNRIFALALMALIVACNVICLLQIKPENKKVCEVEENNEVKEEVEELPIVKEEIVEEAKPENEDQSLIGKTFTLFDGKQNLKVMVVEETANASESKEVVIKPAPVEEVKPAPEVVENNEEDADEEVEEVEEVNEKGEKIPSLTYLERLEGLEPNIKEMYSSLKNELLKHRKMHSRISKSCETFRVGYDVIAKIVVAGKGLKIYLALDPYSVDSAIYHQRDASSKKRFVEVPLVVKVKSPLALKKACQLIDLTCEKKEVLPKSRYNELDYSEIKVEQ